MTGRLTRARVAWDLRRALARPHDRDAAVGELLGAAQRSPYLRATHAAASGAALADLPVLTKADVVEHFDELVTDPHLHLADLRDHVATAPPGTRFGRYWLGVSSGSSGQPVVIPSDRREWVARIANAARARAIAGVVGGRTAKVSSPSAWHLSLQVGSTLADPRKPTLRLPATLPLDQLTAELDRWQPTVLSGYASVLGALACAQLEGSLDISPRAVLSAGEVLTDGVRARVAEAWGVAVHDQYVTTEAGFVASECPAHDGMHVVEDVVVEPVDAEGRPVPEGTESSAVLVSPLASRTLPLVRYRLEDSVVVDRSPCACGRTSPRLRVVGRARALLSIEHAGGPTAVHPVVFSQVLDRHRLLGWQVAHRAGAIEVRLAGADPDQGRAIADQVAAALAQATGAQVPVSVRHVPAVDRGPSGKAAMVADEGAAP